MATIPLSETHGSRVGWMLFLETTVLSGCAKLRS